MTERELIERYEALRIARLINDNKSIGSGIHAKSGDVKIDTRLVRGSLGRQGEDGCCAVESRIEEFESDLKDLVDTLHNDLLVIALGPWGSRGEDRCGHGIFHTGAGDCPKCRE